MNDTARLRVLSSAPTTSHGASPRRRPALVDRLRDAARRRHLERDFADARAELHTSRALRDELADQLRVAIEEIERLERELERARRDAA
jgi:hypothetical protein